MSQNFRMLRLSNYLIKQALKNIGKNQLYKKEIEVEILSIKSINKTEEINMVKSKYIVLEMPKKQNAPIFYNLYSRLLFHMQTETIKCRQKSIFIFLFYRTSNA